MIIWLASYPRSGNTLLRMILKSVFGIETYSKYNDTTDIGADKKTMEIVGHKTFENSWENAYQKMKASNQVFFVKTHEYPEDDSKAIYIVRDGRSAVVSYYHYMKDFSAKEHALFDVITGFILFGSWGGHLDAWDALNRPGTLFLRYEHLLNKPEMEISKIAEFLRLDILGQWKNDFQHLQKINPKFFRKGSSKSTRELRGDGLQLFWLFNGDWMKTLGYTKQASGNTYASRLRELTYEAYRQLRSSETKCTFQAKELNELRTRIKSLLEDKNNLASQREDLVSQKDSLITENSRLAAERDSLASERDRLSAEREEVVSQKDSLIVENSRLAAERDSLASEKNRLMAQRDALLNSLSWRITAPARTILDVFKRGKE